MPVSPSLPACESLRSGADSATPAAAKRSLRFGPIQPSCSSVTPQPATAISSTEWPRCCRRSFLVSDATAFDRPRALRASLASRAALELLTETTQGSEGKDLLRRTSEELGQLSDLIDPLLRWSSGVENLQRQRADLVHVTRQAVASSAFASDTDRVSIVAPDRVLVLADPRHLRSAISNVVRNSLAYAPEASRVRVRIERDDSLARVLVRDRGPGIPTEEQGSLFSPYSRGRSGRKRPGSGLGLFIARRVLEAHGGSISLRTTKAGATFVLELPVESSQLVS
jgi:signal transduction histidine kinase